MFPTSCVFLQACYLIRCVVERYNQMKPIELQNEYLTGANFVPLANLQFAVWFHPNQSYSIKDLTKVIGCLKVIGRRPKA